MSAYPSSYIRDKILEKVLKNTNFTSPSSLYVALYTTDPTVDNTGTECTGGSYARQSVTFAAASGGSIASNLSVTFSSLATATITHYGILDASTAGNLILFGALPAEINVSSGDSVTIASGSITYSITGS